MDSTMVASSPEVIGSFVATPATMGLSSPASAMATSAPTIASSSRGSYAVGLAMATFSLALPPSWVTPASVLGSSVFRASCSSTCSIEDRWE